MAGYLGTSHRANTGPYLHSVSGVSSSDLSTSVFVKVVNDSNYGRAVNVRCIMSYVVGGDETIERSVIDPGPEEVLRIRGEAEQAVVRMGASPATV